MKLIQRPLFLGTMLTAVVVAWLAPITIAGRMPIGGDVTSFFLPLMAYYRDALLQGRVPLWNELWGYGFPFLAESQAGVFYPPHLVLYGMFDVELAYSLNIVLHHLLAAWFSYLCGRTFGLRPMGAAIAALVYSGNGFFIIHFPHQWSYTSGCWMPLAVALAWRAVHVPNDSALGRLRVLTGLALVLGVQMLAGHFQIAFFTQVVVLLMGLACTVQNFWRRIRAKSKRSALQRLYWGSPAGALSVGAAIGVAFVLAAVQLLPTAELIQTALPEGRDFEYLSGFANTPLHFVSYLLPTLFHVNPLWRPVAWDPFHTSPEECFSYIGLLPICLAVGAAWRWRREPRVRLWIGLVLVTIAFSLGPYEPLFRGLIKLPGFDGFRSSARWSIATALFLALLAGRAIDGVRSIDRLRIWLRSFVIVFVLVAGLSGLWCAMMVNAAPGRSKLAWTALSWIDRTWSWVSPWEDRNGLRGAALQAHRPPNDPWTIPALARLGYRLTPLPGELTTTERGIPVRAVTLASEFRHVMMQEMLPPAVMLAIILASVYVVPWTRSMPTWLLFGLVALDLGAAAWLRPTEFVPRGKLTELSPLMGHLNQLARGERVAFDQNLPMLAGAAAVNAYRTVDIPFSTQWHNPDRSIDNWTWYHRIQNRTDSAWDVWEAESPSSVPPPQEGDEDVVIVDPLVAGILRSSKFVAQFGRPASVFRLRRRDPSKRSRAWYWDKSVETDRFQALLQVEPLKPSDRTVVWLYRSPATPVERVRFEPESQEFAVNSTGPGMLIVSELAYPGWEATVKWPDGRSAAVEAIVTQAGCLMVPVASAGEVRVELRYHSAPFQRGSVVSATSFAVCALVLVTIRPPRRRPYVSATADVR
jgi:hypothetical protein